MGKKVIIVLLSTILFFACRKDKVSTVCTGISMSGNKEVFVGKWKWYKTYVKEWFDVGTPIYHIYTPITEGFEYYFSISENGIFKGYRNDSLIHEFILDNVDFEGFGTSVNALTLSVNCSNDEINLRQIPINATDDSVYLYEYPLNFLDVPNKLESKQNFFVRE
jgi:hypothetical protein